MAHFRFLGFSVFIYIDDILLIASSFDECKKQLSAITTSRYRDPVFGIYHKFFDYEVILTRGETRQNHFSM
jgi:hypothetical protein